MAVWQGVQEACLTSRGPCTHGSSSTNESVHLPLVPPWPSHVAASMLRYRIQPLGCRASSPLSNISCPTDGSSRAPPTSPAAT